MLNISLSGSASEAIPNPRLEGTAAHLGCAGIAEPLLRLDHDLRLAPIPATAWKNTAPDTWMLTLRNNVNFHDDSPLGGAAIKASLNVQGDEKQPAFNPGLMRLRELRGARDQPCR